MKKYIKYLIVLLVCLSISVTTYSAKSYIKDLFQAGDNIKIEEELDGTAFIAGDNVEINNKINGIGFLAGNNLDINSKQDYIFGAGMTININTDIEKDTFLIGETINIDKKSNLKRDVYIFADTINLEGNIDRNIYIYGTSVNLKGTFNGNVIISAMEINIDEDAKIKGTLKYNEDSVIEGLSKAINSKTYKLNTNKITFKEMITSTISSYIHIALLAVVLIFICENLFKKSLKQTEGANGNKIAGLCGKGFLILIGVPIIALMLLMSGAFVSVGVIGGLIYGILIYISNIFSAYYLATILDKKYFKKNMNSYLLVIIGLLIIYVVGMIPIIGGFISFISILLGLGIVGNMIIDLKK